MHHTACLACALKNAFYIPSSTADVLTQSYDELMNDYSSIRSIKGDLVTMKTIKLPALPFLPDDINKLPI